MLGWNACCGETLRSPARAPSSASPAHLKYYIHGRGSTDVIQHSATLTQLQTLLAPSPTTRTTKHQPLQSTLYPDHLRHLFSFVTLLSDSFFIPCHLIVQPFPVTCSGVDHHQPVIQYIHTKTRDSTSSSHASLAITRYHSVTTSTILKQASAKRFFLCLDSCPFFFFFTYNSQSRLRLVSLITQQLEQIEKTPALISQLSQLSELPTSTYLLWLLETTSIIAERRHHISLPWLTTQTTHQSIYQQRHMAFRQKPLTLDGFPTTIPISYLRKTSKLSSKPLRHPTSPNHQTMHRLCA